MWRCVVWMVYAVAVVCPAVYIPSYLFLAVTLSGVTLDICWGFAVINCPDSTQQLPRCLHSVSGNSWYPIFTRPMSSSMCPSVRCRCWFKVNVHGKYGILIISSNVPITTSLLCGFRAAQCRQPATLNISFFLKLMWRSSTFNFLCVKNVWFRQR